MEKQEDLEKPRLEYEKKMVLKLCKLCYKILNDMNGQTSKLAKSENPILKNLTKKIQIPDENIFPFINQEITMQEFTQLMKFIYLVFKKLKFFCQNLLFLEVLQKKCVKNFLKIMQRIYRLFKGFFAFLEFDVSVLTLDQKEQDELNDFKEGFMFQISSLFKRASKSDRRFLMNFKQKIQLSSSDQDHLLRLREEANITSFNKFEEQVKQFKIEFNLMRNDVQNKICKFQTKIHEKEIDFVQLVQNEFQKKHETHKIKVTQNVPGLDKDFFNDFLEDPEHNKQDRAVLKIQRAFRNFQKRQKQNSNLYKDIHISLKCPAKTPAKVKTFMNSTEGSNDEEEEQTSFLMVKAQKQEGSHPKKIEFLPQEATHFVIHLPIDFRQQLSQQ